MARAIRPRTLAVLTFVADELDRTGYPPTLREIGAGIGITSTSVARYHLDRLVEAGLLAREDMISRGLTLTPAGYRLLGRPSPVADAALGRALREAAAAGEPAAVRALDVLEVA